MNRHKDIIHLIYNIAKTRKTALEEIGITNLPNIPSLNSLPRDFWDANFLLIQILDSIDNIAATENILFGVELPSGLPNQVLATDSSGVEVNQVTLRGLELSDLPGIDDSKIISQAQIFLGIKYPKLVPFRLMLERILLVLLILRSLTTKPHPILTLDMSLILS